MDDYEQSLLAEKALEAYHAEMHAIRAEIKLLTDALNKLTNCIRYKGENYD